MLGGAGDDTLTLAGGSTEEFQAMALAFSQVGSAGRLQGEEMRQFKNTAFNPLREIAERTGESLDEVKDRMEAAGVPFEEVYNALIASTSLSVLLIGPRPRCRRWRSLRGYGPT